MSTRCLRLIDTAAGSTFADADRLYLDKSGNVTGGENLDEVLPTLDAGGGPVGTGGFVSIGRGFTL